MNPTLTVDLHDRFARMLRPLYAARYGSRSSIDTDAGRLVSQLVEAVVADVSAIDSPAALRRVADDVAAAVERATAAAQPHAPLAAVWGVAGDRLVSPLLEGLRSLADDVERAQ